MNMKKWIALLLTLTLALGLCACGKIGKPSKPDQTDAPVQTDAPETDAPTEAEAPSETVPVPTQAEEVVPATNIGVETIAKLHTTLTEETAVDYNFTEKALEYLNYIGENFQNRSFGGLGESNAHDAAADWIISELSKAGYVPQQIEEQTFEGTTMYGDTAIGRNIILTVPGLDASGQIIVGAHYDGDGLGDNGSGVALLLANAVGLQKETPQYTIKFIFFDGDTDGLYGSTSYAEQMSPREAATTIYMINLDALIFGDFCNLYGGTFGAYSPDYITISESMLPEPENTEAYYFAAETAKAIGQKIYTTEDLDGYYADNQRGRELEDDALFTNPWTNNNPAPDNYLAPSPTTIPASSHVAFTHRGIEYVSFGSTNWFAAGTEPFFSFTGYVETYSAQYGSGGMFMKTEYDRLDYLNQCFPGRAEAHFNLYSPLLSALLLVSDQ